MIIFRNDDISFETDIKRLKKIHNLFFKYGLKEIYSVIPYGRHLKPEESMEDIENKVGTQLVGANKDIVEFLKDKTVSLHGWKHIRMTDYPSSTIIPKAVRAKEYLEELLDTKIKYFTPPYNTIADKKIIENLGMEVLAEGDRLEDLIEQNKPNIKMCYYHWWDLDLKKLRKWLEENYD